MYVKKKVVYQNKDMDAEKLMICRCISSSKGHFQVDDFVAKYTMKLMLLLALCLQESNEKNTWLFRVYRGL